MKKIVFLIAVLVFGCKEHRHAKINSGAVKKLNKFVDSLNHKNNDTIILEIGVNDYCIKTLK